jgi:natural product biosynthesis luciferase-like monooxygenase protein/amino acid adenylation domain-containing protein
VESSQNARFGRIAQTLQGIVGRVLRIEPRDIDIEAPFLELGADSLALVEALRGLQDAFGVKLTIRQLFEQLPSISALAAFLDQTLPAEVAAAPAPDPAPAPVVWEAPVAPTEVAPAPPPGPHPPAPSPATPAPLPGRGGEQPLERVFGMQIQAFNQLVAQQLQMLGGRVAPQPTALPASPPLSRGGGEGWRERGPGGEGREGEAPAATPAPATPLKPVLPTYLGKAAKPSALSERQQKHLDALVERYVRKTAKSKELTQRYRSSLADSRATVGFRPQVKEMLYPLARARSSGSRVWDVDGNEYVDVTMGMGVHLFGHDPEFLRETLDRQVREGFELGPRSAHSGEVAALFCELTGMERAAFTNSGTEACMTAIRLARAKTGKTKIVMFAGSYHGHSDGTLAQTQEVDGELRSFPVAPGIPAKVAEEVLVLDYGSPRALEQIREHRHELATVIVEPIQSRRPDLQPREFLHELRKITAESGIALIFDEMICGFRLHLGGAQAYFGVRADLATYGKIVGGGLPIGVVAGSAEYMDGIDGGMWRYGDDSRPERETTFFGGTFCQHPLAMAAALRTLQYLKEQGPGLQETLNARTAAFTARLNRFFEGDKVPIRAVSAHSLFRFNFSANADLLFYHLVEKGVYVWEWRNCFLSTAHTDADLDFVVKAIQESVAELWQGGFLPEPPSPSGPGPEGGKLAFWDRQGKPSIAPVREPVESPAVPVAADREIRFGLYFFGNYQAEFGAGKYDLLFDCARFGDRHRFAALWFPERHFHPFGGLSPNPSVLAAALARETERIALRAGSVVLPLHHPVRVAEEWALVDNLSGGRVGLSYASGWHPNDFALAPESYGNHRELMFERIETVRRLWQGESIRIKDGAGSDVDLRIYPLPARRDLPIWITIVNNPDTYRRAGEIGAGVLTNLMGQTLDDLARNVAVYREALERAGYPPEAGHVAVLLHTFVGPDAAEAVETARRPFYRYLESSVGLLKSMIASEGHKVDLDRLSPEDLEYMLGLAYQRYVTTSALIGSPDSCAPIVSRMRAIGVDEIACLVDFGVDASKVRESFPWLAALKDRFRESAAPAPARETIDLPLTELQEDLYTAVRMESAGSVAYNEPGTVGLAGPLDLGLLREAFQRVIARHEALRTILPTIDTADSPVQRVLPEVRIDVPLVDVSALPVDLREPADQEAAAILGRQPFDFARGPLIRAVVIRLAPRSHRLFLSAHHLMADGLSVVILLKEVFALYEAGRAGLHGVLPPPFQFREYVEWLRGEHADLAHEEAYWRGVFDPLPPAFEPPTDRPRPPVRTFQGSRESAVFDAELRRAVQQLGRRRGATFFITLLAGWTALLHRWTGQDDVVVGVPLARRPLEGGDRLVGHCVDISPIRSQAAGTTAFADHLTFVRSRLFGAHDHGAYSFARLVRALNPPRDLSRAPLSNVTFNLDQDLGIDRAGGLEITGRSAGVHGVKNDVAVHCLERGEELLLDAEYSTDLFDPATVRRLLGWFRTLLLGAAAEPGAPLSDLPLLDAAEFSQVLALGSAGPRPAVLLDPVRAFEEQAAERPEAPAVVGLPGQRDLSYGELDRLSAGLARRLVSLGIGPEDRVAVCLDRSPWMLAAVLAVLRAGAAYVPLDPGYPAERLAWMLGDARPAALLTRRSLAGALPAGAPRVLWMEELASLPATDHPLPEPASESLAYVLYTSGSTGGPKGVAMSRGALANLLAWHREALPGPRRTLQLASLSFDVSFQEIFSAWAEGGALVVVSEEIRRDPAALWRRLAETGTERLFLPFVALEQLAEAARNEAELPASLLEIVTAGEALRITPAVAELFRRLPGARLANHYGPSETHVVTAHELGPDPARWPFLPPVGRPIDGCRVVLLDRGAQLSPPGVPGEVYLGGAALARGYLDRPELTAERFVPDPYGEEPGARLYRTGDRARWLQDGELEFLGRVDDQVKIRGFRVEPGEVEAALAAHPALRAVAVVVREERPGDRRLVAYVVPAGEAAPGPRDLRDFLGERLPDYLVPAAFVAVPALPTTPSGKVDRQALAATGPVPRAAGGGPRTVMEDLLAAIWTEVLGVEHVRGEDGFFDLGGHSLLATRLLGRVRETLGVELPLRTLFELPTLSALAGWIDRELRARSGAGEHAAPPPIPAAPADPGRERRAPLSFAQERLWFLDRLNPGSILYNLPVAVKITGGEASVPVLAAALSEVMRRHETLRTIFGESEGEPEQVVRPFSPVALPGVDLSGLPEGARAGETARIEREEGRRPFDLAAGPLLRPLLLNLGGGESELVLATHHIVADGWSFGVLGSELAALYRALAAGEPTPLPPLPVQYADFALWQRRWLAGPALEAQLAWWRERLAEVPAALDLPADRPRPAEPTWEGAIEPLSLPRTLADDLRRLARERRATLFMVVLAAFETLLSRLTGRDDFLVGSPIANRTRVETESLIGFFVNTLVLRADLAGEPSFGALLGRVRETTLGAYAHQDLPFEKLVEALAPGRDLSRNPFVQITFAMQNTPRPDPDLGGGLTAGLEELDPGISKFDLTLFFHDAPDGGLEGGIEYGTDLFDAATVRRYGGHLLTLLAAAVAAPETAVSELPLLTAEERDHVLQAWNPTETAYPWDTPVHHLFAEVAARTPEAPAVIEGEETLSYGELARRAGRLASRLRELGVGPEVPVALDLERSSGLIVAMLAVLQAGGAYVPLDPGDPEERRAFLLADTGATVRIDREMVTGAIGTGQESGPGVAGTGDSLAYVLYTSGSTGQPKGVAVPHRGINRLVLDTDYVHLGPGDRVAHLSNTAFDAATFEVWGALLTGAALVVIPKDVAVPPSALAAEVRRQGITAMFLTTALFNEMAREAPEALGGVRHLLFGGEAVSPRRVREARAAAQPGARLLHVYGPTESTTFTTWHEVGEVSEGGTVPIGLPIANTRVYLVDRSLRPVPVGAPGELVIGGDGLARGYLGRPELTAERFVPAPWGGSGERLYRTGDLARRGPDGAIEFLGRTDAQVKVRGFRIEPAEIEAVLAGCPGVRDSAVVSREEAEGRRLVAFAVLDEGAAAPDLRGYLRERLPEWMVPAGLVVLDAFPLTPSGKVDRRALARLEAPDAAGPERPFEAPRTPVEQIVAGLWAEVLERERIGLGDDFFDLGGHSLLAGRVLSRLRGVLGVNLPLREFFRDPTVAGLARRIERARQEAGGVAPPPIPRASRDGRLRLSFGQERLWLAEQLQRGSGAYNSFLPAFLRGRLDVPVLARVLQEIQRRHEVLRTSYAPGADGPVQAIAPASSLAGWFLPGIDLAALPEEAGKAELRRLSADEALRPFDLGKGPLFRPTLLRLAPEEHALFLDLHHSICDGWSLDVLIRELTSLYQAFSQGRPSPLPDLPVQYADFAQWQREWLTGEVFDAQLAWWRRQLGEKPPVLDLPTDRPRPPVQSARGANLSFSLPPELAAGLQELARRSGSTLFTVLLAAFQVLLNRWSGQERVSVGTPVAGRSRVEVEGLIGFFVNTLVLSSDLSGDPTVPELLDRVREVTLGAFDHQDLPFEKLVAALETERDPSRQPLFQAMLVLQNNRMPEVELPGLTLGIVPATGGATQFDLVLALSETADTLQGVLSYGIDLFEAATASLLLEDFRQVLAALAAGSGRLSEIPRLAGEERRESRAAAPAVSGTTAPEEDAAERRRAEIEERRRQLSSRRGQLSPERRALLQKWVGGKAPATEPPPVQADPLVAIRPGGSRTPLFIVHPGAGVTHDYLVLAGHLGPDQPFYALQSPGLAGGELFDSVPGMATRYLEAVRSVQPRGPYRLGGWCTGGVVAFEMARQLLERGEEVELLVLLDSPAPEPGAVRSDELEMLAGIVRQLTGTGFEIPAEELRGIPPDAWLDRVVELGRERGVLPPSFDIEQARRRWQVVRANVQAVESYVPSSLCDVRSLLFRATEQPVEIGDRTSRGWERWLPGPLEILEVEGDHAAPVREPGARLVARHLEVRLAAEEAAAVRSGV